MTPSAFQSAGAGQGDVFVVKVNAAGSDLVYVSVFGGSLADNSLAIAVDNQGSAYVGGITSSTPADAAFVSGDFSAFPVTPGAYVNHGGGADAFITKLNPEGTALVYSSVFGSRAGGVIESLVLDAQGAAYFSALVQPEGGRSDFPTTPGALRKNGRGVVGKLSADGSQLIYSTYLGDAYFSPGAIRVDSAGRLFFSGSVRTPNNPVTANAEQPCFPVTSTSDAPGPPVTILGELDASGSSLLYSTYVGNGAGSDIVIFDADGHYYTAAPAAILDIHDIPPKAAAGPYCVVSSATHLQGPIAPGEVMSIFGSSIGPDVPVSAQPDMSGKISTTLAGLSVLVGGIPAPILYASKGQLNVLAPFGIAAGRSEIQVQGASPLPPLPVTVSDTAPSIFYVDDLTQLAYSFALNQDGTLNAWYNPARWSSILTVYVTGLGPMEPAQFDGAIGVAGASKPEYPIIVRIGDSLSPPADITYMGDAPGLVEGIVQINVRLPARSGPQQVGVFVSATTPSNTFVSPPAYVYVY